MAANSANKARQIAKKKRGIIRAKSDFFRTARYGLTLQEYRVVYYAILKGQQEKRPFEPVTLSIREFTELCEVKGKDYYGKIRNLTKKIMGKVVEVVYKDNKGEHLLQAPWLVGIEYHTRAGTVTITPNKQLQPFFEGKPFTETEFYFLIKFTSQYSERLYEILKSLNHKNIVDFRIDDLRQRLAVVNGKYPNYSDFKRFVLDPAIKDINQYTDIDISMREKRGQYNKVTVIHFSITQKKVARLADRVQSGEFTPPLDERQSVALLFDLLGEDAPEQEPGELPQLPGQLQFEGADK